jgi:deoxyribose-phosphate aldolase
MTPVELAKYLDHTLLAPEATSRDIAKLCQEANEMNVAAICCSPSFLPLAQGLLSSQIAVACVIGFPSGAHACEVKSFESATAVKNGATEVDMVVNLGFVYSAI